LDWIEIFFLYRQKSCKRDLLFADAALTTQTAEDLKQLMGRLATVCRDFGLTISLNKTKVRAQDVDDDNQLKSQIVNLSQAATTPN
jgi:hypothetical protein